MGRDSGGYLLSHQCKRIELSYLLKSGIIQNGRTTQTKISWNDESSISIKTKWNNQDRYILLEYTHTDHEGNKRALAYRVNIIALSSNLGKGQVLFMVCPVSGRLCRKLFMAYGSQYFKSIKAYQTRIYYTGQLSSKLNRSNDLYWHLFNRLESIPKHRKQSHYNGIETKRNIKTEKMYERLNDLDFKRWNDIPVRLKIMLQNLP